MHHVPGDLETLIVQLMLFSKDKHATEWLQVVMLKRHRWTWWGSMEGQVSLCCSWLLVGIKFAKGRVDQGNFTADAHAADHRHLSCREIFVYLSHLGM